MISYKHKSSSSIHPLSIVSLLTKALGTKQSCTFLPLIMAYRWQEKRGFEMSSFIWVVIDSVQQSYPPWVLLLLVCSVAAVVCRHEVHVYITSHPFPAGSVHLSFFPVCSKYQAQIRSCDNFVASP